MDYKKSSQDDVLLRLLQGEGREDVEGRLNTGIRKQEQQLDVFKKILEHCDERMSYFESINEAWCYDVIPNLKDYRMMANFGCYIVTASLTIKSTQKSLYFDKTEWGRLTASSSMCVTLYELCCNIPKLLGKEFYEMITLRIDISHFSDEHDAIRTKLKKYRKDNENYFYNIRNNVSAHRDKDTLKQLSVAEGIEWSQIIAKANDLEDIINDLGSFSMKIINLILINLNNSTKGRVLP